MADVGINSKAVATIDDASKPFDMMDLTGLWVASRAHSILLILT